MAGTYVKRTSDGKYTFAPDTFKVGDFTEMNDASVNDDEFSTVAKMDLRRGEGAALGRGDSEVPEYAEGFQYFDARSANDADADGNADKLYGRVQYVVLNPNNRVVDTIWRGRLDELRVGSADADRSSRQPFSYKTPAQVNEGEVYGEEYAIGIQIELDNGTDTFSLADSTAKIEGYSGEKLN